MTGRYVVITPARDEERFIGHTIQSVVEQTHRPQEWIVVDDGSKDGTAEIVRQRTCDHDWIRLIEMPGGRERKLGGGVVRVFNEGLRNLRTQDYEFVGKLDADLSLPRDYYEFLLRRFAENPRLGIASGCTFIRIGERLVWERTFEMHTRGALKVYRRKCFEDIHGLVAALGWDVVDDHKAQFVGWETQSFRNLMVIHHRQMGSSHKGILAGRMRWGETQYVLNYHPLFALSSGVYRMTERPFVIGGLAMWYGYLRAYLVGGERIAEGELKVWIRRGQVERLKRLAAGLFACGSGRSPHGKLRERSRLD